MNGSHSRPGGILGAIGPFAMLAAAAAYLAARWNDIPGRFVVHWGVHGPDRWATRSIPGVFGLLLIGATVCAFITGLHYAILHGSAPEDHEQRRGNLIAMLVAQFIVAMIIALLSVVLPFRSAGESIAPILLVVIAIAVVGMAVALVSASRNVRVEWSGGKQMARSGGASWKGGVFYRDPGNQALFVPKRFGIGYTLNFGHPRAWVALVALLMFPLAIVALTVMLQYASR